MPSSSESAVRAVVVHVERLGLAARAVEREHQLPAQPLTQREPLDERLELGDELRALAELEVGVDPLLERLEPQLLEPADLALGERLEGEVGERRATPERQRLAKLRGSLGRVRAPRLGDEPLEPAEVEAVGVDLQDVARRPRHEDVRPEQLA